MKRWLTWLVLVVAVGIIAFVVGTVRSRVDQLQTDKTKYDDTAGVGGGTENPVTDTSPSTSDPALVEGEPGAEQTEPVDPKTINTKLARVKYSAANLSEAQAVNTVNDFYVAFNQKNQALVTALFDGSAQPSQINGLVWNANSPFPIAFSFETIAVRGDTSALVTIDEVIFDPAANTKTTRRRLLELIPKESGYLIGKYFTPDTDTPLAGFSN